MEEGCLFYCGSLMDKDKVARRNVTRSAELSSTSGVLLSRGATEDTHRGNGTWEDVDRESRGDWNIPVIEFITHFYAIQ